VHDVFRAVTQGLLRRLVNGAQESKETEKRNNELAAMDRLKGIRCAILVRPTQGPYGNSTIPCNPPNTNNPPTSTSTTSQKITTIKEGPYNQA
jgi:hypothetical protein